MDTPDAAIKRPARTYGRARPQVQPSSAPRPPVSHTDDDDSSFSAADASRDSIDVPLPSSPTARDPPPDSSDNDLSFLPNDDDDGEEDESGTTGEKQALTSFGWKDALKAIDDDDDEEEEASPRKINHLVSSIYGATQRRKTSSSSGADEDAHGSDADLSGEEGTSLKAKKSSNIATDAAITVTDVVDDASHDGDDSLEEPLTAFTQGSLLQTGETSGSSQPRPTHPHARKRAVIHSSDSDEDDSDAQAAKRPRDSGRRAGTTANGSTSTRSSASPETSPGKLHHINTPTNTSFDIDEDGDALVTPPTSQEMPTAGSSRGRGKGKGRATKNKEVLRERPLRKPVADPEADKEKKKVDPLEIVAFDDGKTKSRRERQAAANKGKDKEPRVKAPTKKELAETQKATARIKASAEATIPRANKTLKLSALFETVRESHLQFARRSISKEPGDAERKPADDDIEPIEAFSSSPVRPAVRTTPALTLPQAQRGRARQQTHGRTPSLTAGPILVSNGLLGLGIGPPPTARGMSMSTGKAREKQRTQQSKGKERARTMTPVPAYLSTETQEDVFLVPDTPPKQSTSSAKAGGSFPIPASSLRMSGSDAEDDGALEGDDEEDEDEELPDIKELLAESQRKKAAAEKAQQLKAAKLAYLEQQQLQRQAVGAEASESDDDDMVVTMDDAHEVAKQEGRDRREAKGKGIKASEGRARQLRFAKVKTPVKQRSTVVMKQHGEDEDEDSLDVLGAALGPALRKPAKLGVGASGKSPGPSRAQKPVNRNDLNQYLLRASQRQSREVTLQKEKEFYKGAGAAWRTEGPEARQGRYDERLKELAERGLEKAKKVELEEEDDDDDAWVPQDGEREDESSSDAGRDVPVATEDEDEGERPVEEPMEEEKENDENIDVVMHAPSRHHARVVLDSDEDEDAENRAPMSNYGRILVPDTSANLEPEDDSEEVAGGAQAIMLPPELRLPHRRSISSLEDTDRAEEGTDKENDASLMFDRGEDKENTAVAPQTLLALLSPTSRARLNASEERSPLREITHEEEAGESALGQEEDVFGFVSPGIARSRSRSRGLALDASPRLAAETPSRGLSAFFHDGASAPGKEVPKTPGPGSSLLEPAAIIGPGGEGAGGFSQFFTQAASAAAPKTGGDGFSQFVTPAKGGGMNAFDKLRPPGSEMKLTLDPVVQPALSVDEALLKQADDIFEKDQEIVVGVAAQAEPATTGDTPRYITSSGYYTQTVPHSSQKYASSSPLVITPWAKGGAEANSPSDGVTPYPRRHATGQPSALRRPFTELVSPAEAKDSGEAEEEEAHRPSRLRKRATTPDMDGGYQSSPSPSPMKGRVSGAKRNAFDILGKEKIKAPQFRPPKRRLDKNEFIEGEAEESDEDGGFAFGLPKKKDDEELDGEDQDGILEELVDDAAMDEKTLNEDMVLEKVQEHRALDDAADEKIARDAVEGKLRVKRRNRGVDFDSEDSEEEDPDLKYRRQKMNKKRRIDGDTLDDLAKHTETKPFHDAYFALADDNEEFAHLDHDDFTSLALGGEDVDLDASQENEEEEEQEVMTAAELRKQLQQAARENNFNVIDPDDVSWAQIDQDMDVEDEDVRIKEVSAVAKKQPGTTGQAAESWEMPSKLSRGGSALDIAREQKWARSEGGSRVAGTGRASAVTSLLKSNASAAASGSRGGSGAGRGFAGGRAAAPQAQAGPSRQTAKLTKAPSTLSAMSRRGKFTK